MKTIYSLGESWQYVISICGEFIEGVTRCGTPSLNYDERDAIEASFYNMFVLILHPKNLPLSSENKLVFRFSNQQKHVVFC